MRVRSVGAHNYQVAAKGSEPVCTVEDPLIGDRGEPLQALHCADKLRGPRRSGYIIGRARGQCQQQGRGTGSRLRRI